MKRILGIALALALLLTGGALAVELTDVPGTPTQDVVAALTAAWRDEAKRCQVSRRALRYQVTGNDNSADRLLYNHDDRIRGLWPTLQSLRNVENSALLKVI